MFDFLIGQGDLCFLDDRSGNVGDVLIREGSQHLLVQAGIPFEQVTAVEGVKDSRRKTLLVRGSGGWDQVFHAFMPHLVIEASRHFRQVVILPSKFDPREPIVHECLSRENVVAIAREEKSGRAIARYPRSITAVDCAVYHSRFRPALSGDHEIARGQGTLLVLRENKGSLLADLGLGPDPAANKDISLKAITLDEWFDQIERSELVVTDRLHVAVAAALLGRRVAYVDPYDRKISTYFGYTFGESLAHSVHERSIAWLDEEGFVVPLAG
ncbi:polysaccharide pyruvyl transferase family protein [bacterium]|nr:polysaccharide pyruvyl transferase family protein [bacterium]